MISSKRSILQSRQQSSKHLVHGLDKVNSRLCALARCAGSMPEAKFDRERTLKLRPGFAAGVCRSFLETLRDHLFHGPVNREFGCQRGPESLRSLLPYTAVSVRTRAWKQHRSRETLPCANPLLMRATQRHSNMYCAKLLQGKIRGGVAARM